MVGSPVSLSSNDVRFGSKADICVAKSHVRFTPKSDIDSRHRNDRFVPITDVEVANFSGLYPPRLALQRSPEASFNRFSPRLSQLGGMGRRYGIQ